MGKLLKNNNILIMGVRNKWSIAWGIAETVYDEGANLILTYQGEREKDEVKELADSLGGSLIMQCDISSDEQIDGLFTRLKQEVGIIHGVVHAIAHAKKEDLQGSFVNTSRDGFLHAMNISAYSLVAVARGARELMSEGGSILTLTYAGSERVIPGYNVMGVAKAALEVSVKYLASDLGPYGIRVNAISAGPVKTISARVIRDFGTMLDTVEQKAPLRRGVGREDLGRAALFFLSQLSSGITGEVTHVDCGFNIMGI